MRYNIDGTVRKSNRQIFGKGQLDILNTHIHPRSTPFDGHFNNRKKYYGFNRLTRLKFHLQKNDKYEKGTHS